MKKNDSFKEFIHNYQKASNNYSKVIKFYANNIQIIEGIKKIINEYKECLMSFKKKLNQIQKNLIKPLYDTEQKNHNFSIYNEYITYINNIFNFYIESITNVVGELEQKIFSENDNNNYLNILNQNKNNLINNQISMEKMFLEYNSEHKIFINEFYSIEEDVQCYFFKKRKKKETDPNLKRYNEIVSEANIVQNRFIKSHDKFQENNKKYFLFYKSYMEEIQKELTKKENYVKENIDSFISILTTNLNSLINKINAFWTEEKNNRNKERKSDFNLFGEKNLEKIVTKYEAEKYKIKSIHNKQIANYLTVENKQILKNLNDELDLGVSIDTANIILNEDDVFEVVKFFYGLFNFVDTNGYDLILEKKKMEVRKLTNKLLQPGLIQKKQNYKEYEDLLPIKENEVKILEEYIKKDRVFINTFLLRINNYRTYGIYGITESEFDLIGNYFRLILDLILKETTEGDYAITNLLIILADTFYLNKNGEKYYLNNKLKGHQLLTDIDFLNKCLAYNIKEEFDKARKLSKVKPSIQREDEIIFSTILPFINFYKEMGLNKQQISNIIEKLPKEYNMSKEKMNEINALIESL